MVGKLQMCETLSLEEKRSSTHDEATTLKRHEQVALSQK